jgi:hypothetical protein
VAAKTEFASVVLTVAICAGGSAGSWSGPDPRCQPEVRLMSETREPESWRESRPRIIPCSDLPQTSNKIIQKGLAFACGQSGSVTVPGASSTSGSCPAG